MPWPESMTGRAGVAAKLVGYADGFTWPARLRSSDRCRRRCASQLYLLKEADQFCLFQKRKDRAMNDVSKTPRLRGKHVVVIGGSRGLAVCRRERSRCPSSLLVDL